MRILQACDWIGTTPVSSLTRLLAQEGVGRKPRGLRASSRLDSVQRRRGSGNSSAGGTGQGPDALDSQFWSNDECRMAYLKARRAVAARPAPHAPFLLYRPTSGALH
jgi:hypothetical protein